jgi:hypothetical protein
MPGGCKERAMSEYQYYEFQAIDRSRRPSLSYAGNG